MIKVREYLPEYVDGEQREVIVDSEEALLEVSWIAKWKTFTTQGFKFKRFSLVKNEGWILLPEYTHVVFADYVIQDETGLFSNQIIERKNLMIGFLLEGYEQLSFFDMNRKCPNKN